MTDGRYVLMVPPFPPEALTGTLIDSATGSQTSVFVNGCGELDVFGGPDLADDGDCSPTPPGSNTFFIQVYSLASGETRTVAINQSECAGYSCSLTGIGADWIAFTLSSYHEPDEYWDQNLSTGTIVAQPTTDASTVIDLSSPSLTTRLCSPLRNTSTNRLSISENAQFTINGAPMGRYAIATNSVNSFLERCGSHLHKRLPASPITANDSAVIFPSTA